MKEKPGYHGSVEMVSADFPSNARAPNTQKEDGVVFIVRKKYELVISALHGP